MKIKKYLNMLLSPMKIETISIALEIKLFDLLQKPISNKTIADKLGFDKENTKVFLNSLVILKLLKNKNNKYVNKNFTSNYFVSSSTNYIGDLFSYRKGFFEHTKEELLLFLKKGKEHIPFQVSQEQWQEASKKYFAQEQKALLSQYVIQLISKINKEKKIKNLLDLGCSSGVLSLEILKKNPNFNATLFDFEEVIQQTQANISKYNLSNKVQTICGNIEKDSIGTQYDLILCSNILHLLPQKEAVLEKIYKALNKDGILLILHNNLLENTSNDSSLYFYNLLNLLQNQSTLDDMEFSNLILESGFKTINSFTSKESLHINTKVYIAKK